MEMENIINLTEHKENKTEVRIAKYRETYCLDCEFLNTKHCNISVNYIPIYIDGMVGEMAISGIQCIALERRKNEIKIKNYKNEIK